jgi:hypothetical protein
MGNRKFETVGQLLEFLQSLPPDTRIVQGVYHYEVEDGFSPLSLVEVLCTVHNRDAKGWSSDEKKEFGPCFTAIKFGH